MSSPRIVALRRLHAIGRRASLGHAALSARCPSGSLADASLAELQRMTADLLAEFPGGARPARPKRRRRPAGVIQLRTSAQLRTIRAQVRCLGSLGFRKGEIVGLAKRTIGRPSWLDVATAKEASASISGLAAIVRWARAKRAEIAAEGKSA
jgi:hypothetical protein